MTQLDESETARPVVKSIILFHEPMSFRKYRHPRWRRAARAIESKKVAIGVLSGVLGVVVLLALILMIVAKETSQSHARNR